MLNGEGCVRGEAFNGISVLCLCFLMQIHNFGTSPIPIFLLAYGFPNTRHKIHSGLGGVNITQSLLKSKLLFLAPVAQQSLSSSPHILHLYPHIMLSLLAHSAPATSAFLFFAEPFVHSISIDLPMANLSFRCQFHVSFLKRPPLTTPPPEKAFSSTALLQPSCFSPQQHLVNSNLICFLSYFCL